MIRLVLFRQMTKCGKNRPAIFVTMSRNQALRKAGRIMVGMLNKIQHARGQLVEKLV